MAPSVPAVRDTLLPEAVAGLSGYQLLNVRPVALPAGPAVLASYLLDSTVATAQPPIRDRVRRYICNRHAIQVSLTLSSPEDADNDRTWQMVANSLRWLR